MNGTLESLEDYTFNEDEGAFMFTSESVGEGHPASRFKQQQQKDYLGMQSYGFWSDRSWLNALFMIRLLEALLLPVMEDPTAVAPLLQILVD